MLRCAPGRPHFLELLYILHTHTCMAGWLAGCLAGCWLAGRPDGWMDGCVCIECVVQQYPIATVGFARKLYNKFAVAA